MEALPPHLSPILIEEAVRAALLEDLGRAGDITSNATIPADAGARAVLASREDGILSGMELAEAAFRAIDPAVKFKAARHDGDRLKAGQKVARIEGNARAILAAERVALNYLMRMSGIATCTAAFQQRIAHTQAKICCTRKTIPGHRAFDKYAVKCGGGSNHRFGLDDAILIKDNHIAVAGGVALAIERARAYAGHLVKVEVEVDTLKQFAEALKAGPDVVLLDNMTTAQLSKAVETNRADNGGAVKLEASGNVNIDTVKAIAETGVDYISTSKITMAAPTLDLGLDIGID
ncbi:carboxylating nicotinate-nucleotide diphosphorylase [Salaquimonas pukyongi]|uniref:carboxylating nicotinate-nucleotide diphosphorylase n=1 Tax=Salaquimonas pukyongi TaxID=2712698 RepID=UPI00096B9470|nr:carboxylating nicotinate-nucleotide diphosphorylase [Salaquimonas pukyongi]